MKIILTVFLSLGFSLPTFAVEFEGLCAQKNTASQCTVINNGRGEISQLGWLIEGNWMDYGDDVVINLKKGESTVVSNAPGEENCLFTEFTGYYAYYADSDIEFEPEISVSFDDQDNCTIEIQ